MATQFVTHPDALARRSMLRELADVELDETDDANVADRVVDEDLQAVADEDND